MQPPSLLEIQDARRRLDPYIVETPVWHWSEPELHEFVGEETQIVAKLELFQRTGTFKPRGALTVMLNLDRPALERGVTAVSAGNHAIAVAYASRILDTTAKVVMPNTANAFRVAKCRMLGAEVVLADDVAQAFDLVNQIQEEEGRFFVHPFEGFHTVLGQATVGLEFCNQASDLDAVIVPIGGGGLCAGMASAVKQIHPRCQVFGVEPEGADTMHRSFAAGAPAAIAQVRTIADSLGAPHAAPYSFELCHRFVDDLVLISDDQMRRAMGLLFRSLKFAVEPAGAAATAALCGPLAERLRGRRVGVLLCGTNIDPATFAQQAIV